MARTAGILERSGLASNQSEDIGIHVVVGAVGAARGNHVPDVGFLGDSVGNPDVGLVGTAIAVASDAVRDNSHILLIGRSLPWFVAPLEEDATNGALVDVADEIAVLLVEPVAVSLIDFVIDLMPTHLADQEGHVALAGHLVPASGDIVSVPEVLEVEAAIAGIRREKING